MKPNPLTLNILLIMTRIRPITRHLVAWMLYFALVPSFFAQISPQQASQQTSQQASQWATEALQKLSLEDKVSQLFTQRVFGKYWSKDDPEYQHLVELVAHFKIGGIVFFQGDPFSQAILCNDLQSRATLPLLVAQDMENGVGMRVQNTTVFPPAMALGATRRPDLVEKMGQVIAEEARALGVHQNYAPVADVNNNPQNPVINVRSYGEKPELVSEMMLAYIRGLQQEGMMATVKHFPGHGDTNTDSHADLPVLNFDRTRLDEIELAPFREAIHAGVKSVMVGHLSLPFIEKDPNTPATLSASVTTGILRKELGFKGLIVTDGLGMDGVTKHFDTGEIAVRALEAGADQLVLSQDPYIARNAILNALESGRLHIAQVDSAVFHILRAKADMNLPTSRFVKIEDITAHVFTPNHVALSQEIARASLTLVKNDLAKNETKRNNKTGNNQTGNENAGNENLTLPLNPSSSTLVISLNDDADPHVGDVFFEQVQGKIRASSHRILDPRSSESDYRAALQAAKNAKVVIVPTYFSSQKSIPARIMRFIPQLKALSKNVVQVVMGSPYSLLTPAAFGAVLVAYSPNVVSAQAASEALVGEVHVQGKLPVTVPNMYAFGTGLELSQTQARMGLTNEVNMNADKLADIDLLMRASIADRAFPGAALALGRQNVTVKMSAYGTQTYTSNVPITEHSKFDLASLTKVIGTTTAVMKLYEEGKLHFEDHISDYIPEFGKNGKDVLTIRHVMTHTGGLKAFYPFYTMGINTREEVLQYIFNDKLYATPGSKMEYSDLDLIMMGLIVEKITGKSLDAYLKENFWQPLGMNDTGFLPAGGAGIDPLVGRHPIDRTTVPTEVDNVFRKRLIQGEVHDECAWVLGGTAGHAGLFSSVHDLTIFAQMYLNGGMYGGKRYLKAETIDLFIRPVDPSKHTRAIGWDTKARTGYSSAGTLFGPRSFGHTGFTGTSIWFDPDQKIFAILLTNRVYPTRENQKIRDVRSKYADLVFQALTTPANTSPSNPRGRN
jgi:beta-glucosidase-like glycosyl hydrolase/CubicO group peptidase (beta-lactamase class C family)